MCEIRYAAQGDIPVMSRIHAETWKAAYRGSLPDAYLDALPADKWTSVFETVLAQPEPPVLYAALAVSGGRPSGCVLFGLAREGNLPRLGELMSLYVLPEYWSKKLGFALTEFALDRLRKEGFEACCVWTLKRNGRAARFYERFGFVRDGAEKTVSLEELRLEVMRFSIRL